MQKYLLCLLSGLIFYGAISGQCPDGGVLWKRIIFLKDSTHIPAKEQLAELLPYAGRMESCPYRYDSTHALLLQRIGALYYRLADYTLAIRFTRQAISIINAGKGKPYINPKALGKSYTNLKIYYDSLHEVKLKMESIDSSIAAALRTGAMELFIFYNLLEKVNYYFDVGDYQKCSNYAIYGEVLTGQYLRGKDSIDYIGNFFGWRINALLAVENYDLAEKLLSATISQFGKSGLKEKLDVVYSQLAKAYSGQGDYARALSYLQQELQYNKKTGFALGCKQNLNDIGYIYYANLHDLSSAMQYYHAALGYHNDVQSYRPDDLFESLNIYDNIANIYAKRKAYDSAFYFYQQAFDQIRVGVDEAGLLSGTQDEFLRNKKILYVVSLITNKADLYLDRFRDKKGKADLQKALHAYTMADLLLARIKTGQTEQQSQLFWRASNRHLYEQAIESAYLDGNHTAAFYFFEKSRAALLNDQLREEWWSSDSDIVKLSQLKTGILQLEKALRTAGASSKNFTQVQGDIFSRKQALDRLEQVIQSRDPLYYQSFLDSSFIILQDVQKDILMDHQAMLELFTGDSAIYVLQVTPQHTYLTKLNKKEFDSTAGSYISYISDPILLNSNFSAFARTARHLYGMIFQSSPLPKGRIIISEDGRYFPFEALVTDTGSPAPVYFLSDHAVSYAYSARYLLNRFASNSTAVSGNLIGIAPVQYGSGSGLGALVGSDHSLRQIASCFNYTDELVAAAASKNSFLRAFSGYRIIQLYTHASDSSSNGEPAIYFSDSALYLSDLISEKKPATRLAVLSACETGNGRLYQGEGVFSFSRGFAALGIPSSIANLWDVDNLSTYKLTEAFYQYLAKGMPIDIALQKAKMEFVHSASRGQSLPYFWAAPILVGKTEPIEFKQAFPWKWLAVLVLLGLAGLFFWRWRRIYGRPGS
jgi:CHAT domain-containing protein